MNSYENINPMGLSAELSFVTVAPAFRRTHVHTHAAYLLLSYALDLKDVGGLGFVRVAWVANSANMLSHNAATRLGMTYEGTMR